MQAQPRVSGDRSHLSPVYGKYAPDAARVTETTDIISELDAVLADGVRVEKRTEKVYRLWNRAGERHAEKSDDVMAATEAVVAEKGRIDAANRFFGFLAGVATAGIVAVLAYAVFS
jgi:hypothetical protein